jgi:hypothetical protein
MIRDVSVYGAVELPRLSAQFFFKPFDPDD